MKININSGIIYVPNTYIGDTQRGNKPILYYIISKLKMYIIIFYLNL